MRGLAALAVPLRELALAAGVASMAWSFAPDVVSAQPTDAEAARRNAPGSLRRRVVSRDDQPTGLPAGGGTLRASVRRV